MLEFRDEFEAWVGRRLRRVCCWPPARRTPSTTPTTRAADRQYEQAEQLARDGKYREAAQVYEQLAAQSPGELRDRLLLRAAREYLLATANDKANAMLEASQPDAADARISRCARRSPPSWRCARNPDRALAELDHIPQPLPQRIAAPTSWRCARARSSR